MKTKKLLKRNEFYVAVTIFLLSLVIQLRSGQFFTANNFVDLARAMIIPGMLTMGVMMEIISGGIDVSFPAISMLSMYATLELLLKTEYEGPVALAFAVATMIGLCLGLINGTDLLVEIARFHYYIGNFQYLSGIYAGCVKEPHIVTSAGTGQQNGKIILADGDKSGAWDIKFPSECICFFDHYCGIYGFSFKIYHAGARYIRAGR